MYVFPLGRKIKYADFVSLYPSVNAETAYPVDHPTVIVIPPEEATVNWTHSSQNPYKGILKCLVEPPRKTIIPVLPRRFPNDSRLLFALCPLCAEAFRKHRAPPDTLCHHSTDDRCFVVTLPHTEINEALDNDYIVREVYRVWEFKVFDDSLFADYVRDFLLIKRAASGWPEEFTEEAQRQQYVKEVRQKERIDLKYEDVVKNKGLE